MKTVEIVTTANGWYVTRRYCGQNKGREFFKFDTDTKETNKNKRDQYIKEWVGK